MEKEQLKALGKLLVEKTQEGMKAAAQRHGLLSDGKIDLRGAKVRFHHSDLDLREFLLEGADLSGSKFTNCIGEGVSFQRCVLKKIQIHAEKAKKISFRGASFDEALLDHADIGPRTLDLSQTTYRRATLSEVTFMLPKLEGADFTDAKLSDCYFRNGILRNVSFRNAKLTRVSLEEATLEGADFTGATFEQMEFWGEPNYEGAIISDDLRYQYGEVKDPARRVDFLIDRGTLGAEATDALRRLKSQFADLLSYPACMLIGYELEDAIPPRLFGKILKALQDESTFAN
jgi:uncharacterized protein YjbI with pentapeptide repeats